MFRKFFIALLFLATSLLAQDGNSPDTLLTFSRGWGVYYWGYLADVTEVYYSKVASDTCAWRGFYESSGCGILYKAKPIISPAGGNLAASRTLVVFGEDTNYVVTRGFAMFNTVGKLRPDSCKLMLRLQTISRGNSDSLWIVSPTLRCQSDCQPSLSCLEDSCNFFQCGDTIFALSPTDTYWVGSDTGWISIPLDSSIFDTSDTTVIGLVCKRTPEEAPTGSNNFSTYAYDIIGDSIAALVYWFSEIEAPVGSWGGKNWGLTRWGQ